MAKRGVHFFVKIADSLGWIETRSDGSVLGGVFLDVQIAFRKICTGAAKKKLTILTCNSYLKLTTFFVHACREVCKNHSITHYHFLVLHSTICFHLLFTQILDNIILKCTWCSVYTFYKIEINFHKNVNEQYSGVQLSCSAHNNIGRFNLKFY